MKKILNSKFQIVVNDFPDHNIFQQRYVNVVWLNYGVNEKNFVNGMALYFFKRITFLSKQSNCVCVSSVISFYYYILLFTVTCSYLLFSSKKEVFYAENNAAFPQ